MKQTDIIIESVLEERLTAPSIQSWIQNEVIFLNGIVPKAPYKIASYYWSLGDGQSSTNQMLSHRFTHGGVYNISLNVTDIRGNQASSFKIIRLNYVPYAAFNFTIGDSNKVTFDASPSFDVDGFIAYSNWTFGDGQQRMHSTIPSFNYTYSESRIYTVTLAVEDNEGAQSCFTINIDLTINKTLDPILITENLPLFGLLWHNQAQRNLAMAFNQSDLSDNILTLQEQASIQSKDDWIISPNLMFYNHPFKPGYMIMNENNGFAIITTPNGTIQLSKNYTYDATVFAIYSYGNSYQFVENESGKYLVAEEQEISLSSNFHNNNNLWSMLTPKNIAWTNVPQN